MNIQYPMPLGIKSRQSLAPGHGKIYHVKEVHEGHRKQGPQLIYDLEVSREMYMIQHLI